LWLRFQCYELTEDHLFDHIVVVKEDDMDNWSVSTGSSSIDSAESPHDRGRTDSMNSVDIVIQKSLGGSTPGSPRGINKARSNSSVDILTHGIGVKRLPGKPRSNSAISALSMDECLDNEDGAGSPSKHDAPINDAVASLSSLAFEAGTSQSVY
jgi:hypothetical protein